MSKSKKTFWPYGILLSFVFIISACVATIVISLDHPVHMDNYYLSSYQDVDRKYNEIEISQKEFDQKYSVKLKSDEFERQKDIEITIEFTPKNGGNLQNMKSEVLLTRPETNQFDRTLSTTLNANTLTTEKFQVDKQGRWQIMAKFNDGKDIGFYRLEFFVK